MENTYEEPINLIRPYDILIPFIGIVAIFLNSLVFISSGLLLKIRM